MTPDRAGETEILHASCVVFDGRALMLTGAAGAGKSAVALGLMAFGCGLIADDQTEVFTRDTRLWVRAPASLPALIEARGIGLLAVAMAQPAPLIALVDLDSAPQGRLPRPCHRTILGHDIPLIAGLGAAHVAPALLQILKTGQVPRHG